MAGTQKPQGHTRDEVWATINQQSGTIADIKAGQAATDARLGALETAVETGFRTLAAEIHGLAERSRPKETNYIGLFVGFVTVLGLFGSFALLIAKPIEADAHANRVESREHLSILREHGSRVSSLEAQIEMLNSRVEDIDNRGSRRWNDREPQ